MKITKWDRWSKSSDIFVIASSLVSFLFCTNWFELSNVSRFIELYLNIPSDSYEEQILVTMSLKLYSCKYRKVSYTIGT